MDYHKLFCNIPKPFAFLDLDQLNENIRTVKSICRNKAVRIASKSLRCVPVIQYLLQTGSPFQGIMCYTASEALFLSKNGLDDLLVAYPVWDEAMIHSVACAVKEGKTIILMVDCDEHVERIASIAHREKVVLPVCLDMDLSVSFPMLHFGVYRSPLSTLDAFLQVAKTIHESRSVRLDGVMGYEAQVAGVGEQTPYQPLKNLLIRLLKKHSVRRCSRIRKEWIDALSQEGLTPRFINGGGTGSLSETAKEETVTEITVGSAFYSPTLFDHYRNLHYQPAAGFALEITRKPRSDVYTCTGGGYIASGAAGSDRLPRPFLPKGASLVKMEGAGEVQTPVRLKSKLHLGDPIFFRHAKAGELCEHFNELIVVSNGAIVDRFPTYRGEGACFL
ncbi:amino acid deaminase/aldolase [Melghirimyces algeriensis]|nr:amino acid deaminase/aldolase [Melghirimyces algeriensis]